MLKDINNILEHVMHANEKTKGPLYFISVSSPFYQAALNVNYFIIHEF
ncbi:5796_t:CDS:2 [Cetraspora pellucida]|uniref:5796_t:CDS:1 n=1 Tax=Cetraspora pellucida TaxID=1433469 RepID=A0A9N8ZMM7_9GLOM|nr:5796_t:CDS:2 [Cetraspora pellucida]